MVVRRGRRRTADGSARPPEAAPGPLDAGQGARLRSLVRQSFARHGVKVSVDEDHAEAVDGTVYALLDLDTRCRRAPETEWQGMVDTRVSPVVRFTPGWDPVAGLGRDEVLARVFLHVADASALHDTGGPGYPRPLVGDLVEVMVLDLGGHLVVLGDDQVTDLGSAALREAGRANLLGTLGGGYSTVEIPDCGTFHVVTGESPHVASSLLVFEEVLHRTLGNAPVSNGALVAVPDRHSLLFHPVTDASVVPVLQTMAEVVARSPGSVGPVSPFVYWWRPGALTQLSRNDGRGGRLRIAVDDEFGAVLETLAAG